MAKKSIVHNSVKKSQHQGPIIKPGSGISGSSIPRAGHPPAGRGSHSRYDQHVDCHSVDTMTKKG